MNNGDIIKYDYDIIIGETNELYETTRAETAKKYNRYDEKKVYQPTYAVMGTNAIIKGLEKALAQAEVGATKEIELEPSDAFGERDPKLVETHSIQELKRLKIEPEYGKEIILKNKSGRITGISTGRVRVDFNNPLAGKKLKISFTVHSKVETPEEKIKAIITMAGANPDEFRIHTEGDMLDLTLPESAKYDQTWILRKIRIVKDLRTYTDYKIIRFIEEYQKKEEKKEEKEESKKEEKKEAKEGGTPKEASGTEASASEGAAASSSAASEATPSGEGEKKPDA